MNPEPFAVVKAILPVAFVGTWIVLGMVLVYLLFVQRDVTTRRKWYPRVIILVAVLFLVFSTSITYLSAPSARSLAILIPGVPMLILISWLNIKFTKFCDGCGATIVHQTLWIPLNFCPKCGAKLRPAKPAPSPDLPE